MVSGGLFFIQKLHEFNDIQYVDVTQNINKILYDLTNLHINVNFNKMLQMFIFQQSYEFNTHPINKLSNAGAALVNNISSLYRRIKGPSTSSWMNRPIAN